MKKKFFSKLALLSIVTLSLSACGSGNDTKDTTTSGNNKSSTPVIKVLNLKPEIDTAFQAYAKDYSAKNDVTVEVETCGGSNCDYESKLDQYIAAGKTPDIFLLEGQGGFDKNKDLVADLSTEKWVSDTEYAFVDNNKTYGFPLGIEGFGLTYNLDILEKVGIDPASLTSFDAYETAFKTLEEQKEELGITAPVAMATGSGMHWVGGLHGFNGYLSGGLELGDTSVLEDFNAGKVSEERMQQYGDMMDLIFRYADASLLTAAGDQYGNQVKLFTDQKTAFIHQGNWIDNDIADSGLQNVGIAPAPYGTDNNVYLAAPSYLFVHKDSKYIDEAKQFLDSIQSTTQGNEFMYKSAASISPFKSVQIEPETPLAKSIYAIIQNEESASPWNQNDLPSNFGMQKLGPIHEAFAKNELTKEQFIEELTKQGESLK